MSWLVAPHVTNWIQTTFKIQAKKDEIHAKKTYEIQIRLGLLEHFFDKALVW